MCVYLAHLSFFICISTLDQPFAGILRATLYVGHCYLVTSLLLSIIRLFGGLVADIKRKAPFYASDFKDAIALQSVASVVYIFIVRLAPIVTFGGLLGVATENNMVSDCELRKTMGAGGYRM